MLIRCCAWHPGYYGHRAWMGIAAWRGWGIRFTDGICPRCAARFQAEYHEEPPRRGTQVDRPSIATTAA